MDSGYIFDRRGSHSKWRSSEEFQEEDVWGAVRTKVVLDSDSSDSSRVAKQRLPTAARMMIPKSGNNNNNNHSSSSNRNPTEPSRIIQQSAPVNIPDWSKIYRSSNSKPGSCYSWLDPDSDEDYDDGNRGQAPGRGSWESDEDEEGNVLPPHEWVAKKLARSQISSFSVFEGAGRTLKGRDLSRVRNDVLTKTGFLE